MIDLDIANSVICLKYFTRVEPYSKPNIGGQVQLTGVELDPNLDRVSETLCVLLEFNLTVNLTLVK